MSNRFAVAATTAAGEPLWQYELPKGKYMSLGTTAGGSSVTIHALQYPAPDKRNHLNCILGLDPASGNIAILGSMGRPEGTSGSRLSFVGDSLLARVVNGQFEIWKVDADITLYAKPIIGVEGRNAHIDLVSADSVAITAGDAAKLSVVSLSSAGVSDYVLQSPEIDHAKSLAQTIYARSGMDPQKVPLPTVWATGSDRKGLVYTILSPIETHKPAQMVTISQTGIVQNAGSYQFPAVGAGYGPPILVLVRGSELGIVFGFGNVAWYAS
jgi:hypothetical protein